MIKLFSILLITIGSFLEIWYYWYRFSNDGIDIWLGITIGIALTLFLALAILNRKKKGIKLLILSLIIYSVLATSAGQSFSLSIIEKEETQNTIAEEYRQDDISDIETRIKEINTEYETIQNNINATVETLHDRGTYRTALGKAETRLSELNIERTKLRTELTELRQEAITYEDIEQKKTNVYQFYYELTGIPEKWLQFILQTILSIFIAIMAPLGIITIQGIKNSVVEKTEKQLQEKKKKDWNRLIDKWVDINWTGIRSGKSKKILPKKTFLQYTDKHEQKYTEKEYNIIYKSAIITRCIDKNNKVLTEQKKAVEIINNYIGSKNENK